MKIKKNIYIFFWQTICICFIILFIGCNVSNKTVLFSNGNFKDNMSDFSEPIKYNTESPMVDSYYKNVSYTVESIDTDKNTIVLNVSVPDFATILEETIDESINNKGG